MRPDDRQDHEVIAAWYQAKERGETMRVLADRLGYQNVRALYTRRRRIEAATKQPLPSLTDRGGAKRYSQPKGYGRVDIVESKPYTVIISSDHHTWGEEYLPAMRALLWALETLKPKYHILNGDILDFPGVSKFKPVDAMQAGLQPNVEEEIDRTQRWLKHCKDASKKTRTYWIPGNHDRRFSRYVIGAAPELAMVKGAKLEDHFTGITWADVMWLNADRPDTQGLVVKHEHKSSKHAAYNAPLHAGKSTAHGHIHRLGYRAITDYSGIRYGIETGFIGAIDDDSGVWGYTDHNPVDWQPGFMLVSIWPGEQVEILPEPVHVKGEFAYFRGERIKL